MLLDNVNKTEAELDFQIRWGHMKIFNFSGGQYTKLH